MKRLGYAALIFLLIAALSGCGGFQGGPADMPQSAYEVQDGQGKTLKLPHKPQRIASLSIGTDEVLVHLVAPERIAALTYLADDPEISNITAQAQSIATKVRANPEQLIALQPDLLLVPDWQPQELIDTLRQAGLPVYMYHAPNTIEQIKQMIGELSRVVGEEAAGQQLIAGMDSELAAVRQQVDRVAPDNRLIVLQFSLLGATGGTGSLFDDICKYAGVRNGGSIAGLGKFDLMSQEQMIKVNPDVLIMPMWDSTGRNNIGQYREKVRSDPGLQSVKAVKNDRLIPVPDRFQSSASHYIVYGVREVARAAYPELDWQ